MTIEVKKLKIDPDGRYMLILEVNTILDPHAMGTMDYVQDRLNEWWKSGEKFAIVKVDDRHKLTFERMRKGMSDDIDVVWTSISEAEAAKVEHAIVYEDTTLPQRMPRVLKYFFTLRFKKARRTYSGFVRFIDLKE